jgi:hypothetical protein
MNSRLKTIYSHDITHALRTSLAAQRATAKRRLALQAALARGGICAAVLLIALATGILVAASAHWLAAMVAGAVFTWGFWSARFLITPQRRETKELRAGDVMQCEEEEGGPEVQVLDVAEYWVRYKGPNGTCMRSKRGFLKHYRQI